MCKTGENKAEYGVHSMHMDRLSACREFCGVDSVRFYEMLGIKLWDVAWVDSNASSDDYQHH